MRTLAGWCVGHRRAVLLFWFALLVGSIALVSSVGTNYSNNFNFPHTQSFDAINLLKSVAPGRSGDSEQIVFGTSGGAQVSDTDVGLRINKKRSKRCPTCPSSPVLTTARETSSTPRT
jgi:RND superfamily putative drug exporter